MTADQGERCTKCGPGFIDPATGVCDFCGFLANAQKKETPGVVRQKLVRKWIKGGAYGCPHHHFKRLQRLCGARSSRY